MKQPLMKTVRAGSRVARWMLLITFLAMTLMVFSCSDKDEPRSNPDLLNMSQEDLVAHLGEPTGSMDVAVNAGDPLPEYQSSLLEHVPESGPLEVRELTWKRNDKTIKVWLKQSGESWESFDTLEWSANIRL